MIEMEDIPITKDEYIAMVKTINQLRKEKQHLIDKACKWLNNFYNEETHSYLVKEDIENFRKAMEEEQ